MSKANCPLARLASLAALVLTFVLLLEAFVPALADAALKRKGSANLAETWNPHPDRGDIVLPMPKGLSMAFRVVAVPANGYLWSMTANMGIADNTDPARSWYDSSYKAVLSAPFSGKDVPAAWKKSLPEHAEGQYFYYLIAKYEVSRLQWQVIMDENADTRSLSDEDARPVTEISWYEALVFTQRYTEWLLANHPDLLPTFQGDARNTGFVRLPTEAEWEYAARGGQHDTTNYRQQDFFSMAEGTDHADYAVFREEGTSHNADTVERIGSRRPNPLGLYDTAGNAAEMTLDAFRFSMAGSLQGSAGGFVRKGGSYLSDKQEILPGRREEMAPFLRDGVLRARDLGFRPVVSGVNTPGGNRPAELKQEYASVSGRLPQLAQGGQADTQSAGKQQKVAAASTPLEELDRLIANADNDGIRKNLVALRGEIEKTNILQSKERVARIEAMLRGCIQYLESIRNYDYKKMVLETSKARAQNFLKLAGRAEQETAKTRDAVAKSKKLIEQVNATLKELNGAIDKTALSYRNDMQDVVAQDAKDVQAAMQSLTASYAGTDPFNKRMSKHIAIIRGHYADLRKGKKLTQKNILARLDQD